MQFCRVKRGVSRPAVALFVMGVLTLVPATVAHAVGSVSMTAAPSATVSWTLGSAGANTISGGTMTLNATAPYTVTVSSDRATMAEYNSGAYVTSGKTLGAGVSVTAARTGGTATVPGVGSTALITTVLGTLVTGTGIGTDTFGITLSQPTTIADPAILSGHTYHIVLTYTAQLVL